MYARPIDKLIRALCRLPSVGERTAGRFVFFLLKAGKKEVGELIHALTDVMEHVQSCETCWDFSDTSPCATCANPRRTTSVLCVVEEPQDVQVIERSGAYDGRYHVLRGTVRPEDELGLRALKIPELLARITRPEMKEVVLAFNPDLPGETTMMYLAKKLTAARPDLRVTRLARGLPMGSDIEYADDITLGNALKFRQ